jgi:DnaJ-class molecular chaperone
MIKMDIKCTKCDGAGRILSDGDVIKCPVCEGDGVKRITALITGAPDTLTLGCYARKPRYFED